MTFPNTPPPVLRQYYPLSSCGKTPSLPSPYPLFPCVSAVAGADLSLLRPLPSSAPWKLLGVPQGRQTAIIIISYFEMGSIFMRQSDLIGGEVAKSALLRGMGVFFLCHHGNNGKTCLFTAHDGALFAQSRQKISFVNVSSNHFTFLYNQL